MTIKKYSKRKFYSRRTARIHSKTNKNIHKNTGNTQRIRHNRSKQNAKLSGGSINIRTPTLEITYNTNTKLTNDNPTDDFTNAYNAGELNNQPKIIIGNASGNGNYLLVMYDPDAPNGMNNAGNHNYIHWIFTHRLGTSDGERKDILEYRPPSPPRGTHRYIFKLYNALEVSNEEIENLKNGGNNIKLPRTRNLLENEMFFKVNSRISFN